MTRNVALFVTCLVDIMRPRIGFAAIRALEAAGCEVVVPQGQTCCGQPALNSGDRDHAVALAKQTIAALEPYEAIVVPSGSCAGTIRCHYPELFEQDATWLPRAQAVAAKTFEVMAYLDEVCGWKPDGVRLPATATYHDSCSGLRELGIKAQPRRLLNAIDGLSMSPLSGAETCCGFGGTFCVKYPAISNAIVGEKAAAIDATGANLLLAGDLGCLMNMAGKLHRDGSKVRAFHAIELIAGMGDGPAIGEEA
ncbi:Predicted L-lactate dehydrogenase, Fe-S oxidoreductase subunit YkgE [Sphingobium indicum BiD32]|uniref:Predicted L-lactate dehydrogenase, Fe-S oxidoreductase subunit YkgE n=1 Tax=Sphingobium indicum BiD32 TaxID=1301087 RepID=N1MST7_9SPHN|nr:(Fe-S)-binding protein [Sphingobium indicum]CCW19804.1 Predicted L-lactate dehydrogenase, Fe-S oxidoreductase subunit YkgE [Sphingobium indicum BiD32]